MKKISIKKFGEDKRATIYFDFQDDWFADKIGFTIIFEDEGGCLTDNELNETNPELLSWYEQFIDPELAENCDASDYRYIEHCLYKYDLIDDDELELSPDTFYSLFDEALYHDTQEEFIDNWCMSYDISTLELIYKAAHMSVRDIVKLSGLSQAGFSRLFNIPKRTVENWTTKNVTESRQCLPYIRLMLIRLLHRNPFTDIKEALQK